jgi:hypothetical protein
MTAPTDGEKNPYEDLVLEIVNELKKLRPDAASNGDTEPDEKEPSGHADPDEEEFGRE